MSTGLGVISKMDMDNIKLFEEKKVRSHWDEQTEKFYFSVIDVIEILSESPRPRKYWNALKAKLQSEGSEVSHNLGQLKMQAEDCLRTLSTKSGQGSP